jgi:hypothetical protein
VDGRDAAGLILRVGGRALLAKAAGVALVVCIVFLLLLGLLSGGPLLTAAAASCGDRGTPKLTLNNGGQPPPAQTPGSRTRQNQITNAKIIDSVAASGRLSGRATLIALMTALQESTLLNLEGGHLDSVGLFQQRPSAGWGTRAQLQDPEYAARMFFYGGPSGSPRGLTDIPQWDIRPMGEAAQAVQHSKYPDLYAGQDRPAREIARLAKINLHRIGFSTGLYTPDREDPDEEKATSEECYTGTDAPGAPGAPFHDSAAPWPTAVRNPRSTEAAIRWAEKEAQTGGRTWYRACLAFAARTHGWNFSGVHYAIDHYRKMPTSMKHHNDRTPAPGALMYWDTGQRAGHVAVYLGNGKIASNDIRRPGYIDVVPATDIETKWGAKYLGWAPPYFPQGG